MKSAKLLNRITDASVSACFRGAWQGRENYPSEQQNCWVAIRINTIVDRSNARSVKNPTADALKERREQYLSAKKHARALGQALPPIERYLRYEKDNLGLFEVDALAPSTLADQIHTIEEMRRVLGNFLALFEPPGVQDHMDPILWIADAAKKAWESRTAHSSETDEQQVSFDKNPDAPLVAFIRLALKGIGLAEEGHSGYSLHTISDHLRGRQNRTRKRQSTNGKGAK